MCIKDYSKDELERDFLKSSSYGKVGKYEKHFNSN